MKSERVVVYVWILSCCMLGISGCSDEDVVDPVLLPGDSIMPVEDDSWEHGFPAPTDQDITRFRQWGDTPPPGLVNIQFAGESLTCWPYTGTSYDGAPMDPVNLVFVGEADPVQIRAALMSLDGDRTAYGFPPAAPFDAIWADAVGGDVQTAWAGEEGWLGSVVQLQLGGYAPLRAHLRLFHAGESFGDGGTWTLGGAHFEVMIPGTADHQVLGWEIAQQLVVADLMRSGLLDPDAPLASTGAINAAPSFRDIPPEIYNGLPAELIALVGGPSQPVSESVPLVSDGEGTVLHLTGATPVEPGVFADTVTITYGQFVPRPFCMESPYDWLYVTGPLVFDNRTTVTGGGRYAYRGGYRGVLEATPVDISTGEPVGPSFLAKVSGRQAGRHRGCSSRVVSVDRRMTMETGGPQIHFTRLVNSTTGVKRYDAVTRCLDDE
ncbi:hypothetical protein KKG45_04630 [bacterium]|nr:hypothetical protein [bacterium]MBU1072514.1 hypothetical protein [bacterium]MBU1676537.1 hypothetical protein [bacterium]